MIPCDSVHLSSRAVEPCHCVSRWDKISKFFCLKCCLVQLISHKMRTVSSPARTFASIGLNWRCSIHACAGGCAQKQTNKWGIPTARAKWSDDMRVPMLITDLSWRKQKSKKKALRWLVTLPYLIWLDCFYTMYKTVLWFHITTIHLSDQFTPPTRQFSEWQLRAHHLTKKM